MLSKPQKYLSGAFLVLLPLLVPLTAGLLVSRFYWPLDSQIDFVVYSIMVIITIGLLTKLLLSFTWFEQIMTYHDTNKRYEQILFEIYDNIRGEIESNELLSHLLKVDESQGYQKSLFNDRDYIEEYKLIITIYTSWRITQYAKKIQGIPKWTDFETGLLLELSQSDYVPNSKILIKIFSKRRKWFNNTHNSIEYFDNDIFKIHILSEENKKSLRNEIDKLIKKEASKFLYKYTVIEE